MAALPPVSYLPSRRIEERQEKIKWVVSAGGIPKLPQKSLAVLYISLARTVAKGNST
jgi:hypothetical protein